MHLFYPIYIISWISTVEVKSLIPYCLVHSHTFLQHTMPYVILERTTSLFKLTNLILKVPTIRLYSNQTIYSLTPSPLLWRQQHLFLLHVTLPCLLRWSVSTHWLWDHPLYGGMPVCPRLRHEWGHLRAVHPVWLHLPQQILPRKSSCATVTAANACHWFDDVIPCHPSSHPSICNLQLKEKFVTEDCSQSCECTTTGAVCQPKTCEDGYICTIFDLKRDCYRGVCLCFLLGDLYNHI